MKTMRLLCGSLAGLLLLSACNDNNGSTPSNATQSNEMTGVVSRVVVTSPEDASPVDIESMTVSAPEDTEPTML